MPNLKQKHSEYIASLKAKGEKTLTFTAPCCGKKIEDRAANKGETWDSLMTCPHCTGLFMKIATDREIVGLIPETEKGE